MKVNGWYCLVSVTLQLFIAFRWNWTKRDDGSSAGQTREFKSSPLSVATGIYFLELQIFLVSLELLDFDYSALNSCLAYPLLFADVLDDIFDR